MMFFHNIVIMQSRLYERASEQEKHTEQGREKSKIAQHNIRVKRADSFASTLCK